MKRFFSTVLCFVLVLGMLPPTAMASPAESISEIVIKGIHQPQAGDKVVPVNAEMDAVISGIHHKLNFSYINWADEKGRWITGDYTYFEAGLTYSLCTVILQKDEDYLFDENCRIVLDGIDPDSYTYSVDQFTDKRKIEVKIHFSIPGEYVPQPISRIDLEGGLIRQGEKMDLNPVMCYNRAYLGGVFWDGEFDGNTFKGEETYEMVAHVYDYEEIGFVSYDELIFTYNAEEYPANYEWFAKEKMLRIQTFITVPKLKDINEIRALGLKHPLYAGTSANEFAWGEIHAIETEKYMSVDISPCWYDSETDRQVPKGELFVEGKEYYFTVTWKCTDPETHRFSPTVRCTLNGLDETDYLVYILYSDSQRVEVRYYLRAQEAPGAPIEAVNIHGIDVPRPGVEPDYGAEVYDPGYQISEVRWYNDTGKHYISNPDYTFEAGADYTVEVSLETGEDFDFQLLNYTASINGAEAQILSQDKDTCTVQLSFQDCQIGQINDVEIWNLSTPVPGEAADFQVNCGPYYSVTSSNPDYNNGVGWYDMTEERYLTYGETFREGHQYHVEMELMSDLGYQFSWINATVNGETAEGIDDSDRYAMITYTFPPCPEEYFYHISNLEITEINAPQPEMAGDYTPVFGESTYFCQNLSEGNIVKGVLWYDLTAVREMAPGNTYEAGHDYQIRFYLECDDKSVFVPDIIAKVNGQGADCIPEEKTAIVMYTFPTCTEQIAKVDIVSVDAPKAGEKPDYFVTCKGMGYTNKVWNDKFMHNGVQWYDVTGEKYITPDDAFLEGHTYQVLVTLVTEKIHSFGDTASMTGTVNANDAEVLEVNGEVVLRYQFPQVPVAPTEPSETEPEATTPMPTEPKPTEPLETEPQPTEPKPTEPLETEPHPSEPKPTEPESTDPETVNPFTDVKATDYYYDPVLWAVDMGITTGTTSTTFSPTDPCTRAQAVTFLWRSIASPPGPAMDCPFTDVKKGTYYFDAVQIAVHNGITTGTSSTTFSPDEKCTRAQIVTFLWRMFGQPKVETKNPFKDVSANAYYYDAVLWAVKMGITTGTSETQFSPDADCTRAQIVTFLYRAITRS